ncbi:cellulose binding domain-containing protein [Archangium lipolyticum]|uniref:cellulose binding domain-containing protein n=1 Tax=Archangium lipolyticum TaxID=2970465 RepID=UPI00214A2B41|nr:cellulose binding domain-containing protein [Archangium lipolyticum]
MHLLRNQQTRQGTRGMMFAAVLSVVVPSGASLAGTTDFTVQYQNYNAASPSDNIIEAGIKIRNNTAASIPLSNVVVRYWFTKNGATTVSPVCWWWNPACSALVVRTGSVSATGADQYVEIGFTSSAGSLAPGASTQPIDLGITFGGTNVNETDDYSYANQLSFADWSRITVHDAGSTPLGGLRGGTLPGGGGGGDPVSAEFFDDFSYTGNSDPNFTNWWSIRTYAGKPGVDGAQWLASNVSMVADPSSSSNKLMRLRASTSGTGASTSHVEVLSRSKKFQFGTYATRMKFNDIPLSGSRFFADKPIETFFTITNYVENDPNYSEQDFEYMPNGGWGQGNTSTMWLTSWETTVVRTSYPRAASHDGWHTLVLHVSNAGISYYIDGVLWASHAAMYAPEAGQYLAYQLWFDELDTTQGSTRTYYEETDWVYFAKDALLSPNEVAAKVSGFRTSAVTRKDTVP